MSGNGPSGGAEDEKTSVIAYEDDEGTSLRVDALYIRRLVLADDAPERLATVAFGLMAISAYRLGFDSISGQQTHAIAGPPQHFDHVAAPTRNTNTWPLY